MEHTMRSQPQRLLPADLGHALQVTVLASLAAAVIACSSSGGNSTASASPPPAANAPADATQAPAGSGQTKDLSSYTYEKKEEFMSTMKAQLDKLNGDIEDLSAKIDKSSDASKADAKVKLQALRDRAAKLGDLIGKSQDATADTWEKVKSDVSSGYDDLQKSLTDARQWLSDKIAP
jgi:hypothetical protein